MRWGSSEYYSTRHAQLNGVHQQAIDPTDDTVYYNNFRPDNTWLIYISFMEARIPTKESQFLLGLIG